MAVFKAYVTATDPEGGKSAKRELDLDAILWHFENGIEQFLNEIKLDLPEILDKLRKEWEQLKKISVKMGEIEAKEMKLCKFQEFIERRFKKHRELMKNEVWKEHLAKSEFIVGFYFFNFLIFYFAF